MVLYVQKVTATRAVVSCYTIVYLRHSLQFAVVLQEPLSMLFYFLMTESGPNAVANSLINFRINFRNWLDVSQPKQHPLQCWLLILVQEATNCITRRSCQKQIAPVVCRSLRDAMQPPPVVLAAPFDMPHPSICHPCGSCRPLRDAITL